MGVHGLWELLAPVGCRVSVETLTGKKLSIDASIWMIQFIKAMRDEKGEMVRNAHILGFFRRICKLLYLLTKPVFVFDGGTTAFKLRTVIARRRQRENAQAKIRKTAEKLLLNHVKAMRLNELAADLENQRQKNDVKGKKAIIEEPNTQKVNDEVPKIWSRVDLDEMLVASLAAEENEDFTADAPRSAEMHGKVDPAVLVALLPSSCRSCLWPLSDLFISCLYMRERLMTENRQKYQKLKKVLACFTSHKVFRTPNTGISQDCGFSA